MRSAGNFHPEWGYLAPVPSFVRRLRIALLATAIGATAGAGVVVSLVAHPAAEPGGSSIAKHALVTGMPVASTASAAIVPAHSAAPVQSAGAPSQPAAAHAQPAEPAPASIAFGTESANAVSAALQVAPPPVVANPAAAEKAAPAPAADPMPQEAAIAPEPTAKKATTRRHHVSGYEAIRRWHAAPSEAKRRPRDERGFEPLFRLFSFRGGSYSAN